MRFILSVFLLALVAGALQVFLPWWAGSLACFAVSLLLPQPTLSAFWAGFWAIFLLWGGYAFWIDFVTESFLTLKVMKLFPIPSAPILLILLTALLGGLVGGFSALTGNYLRNMLGYSSTSHSL